MRFLPTQAARLDLPTTRTLLTKLGRAFEAKADALATTAARAERQRAAGLAADAGRAAAELRAASADVLRLSAELRGMPTYAIKDATAAAKERASAGLALAAVLGRHGR